MKRQLTTAFALVIALSSAASARERGSVDLNINLGVPVIAEPAPPPPPRVALRAAPRFIFSPFLGMYVSVGIPYDIVYLDDGYYLNQGGYWYRAPYYDGPWVLVESRRLPAALHRHRLEQIRHHRDEEFGRFEREREHYRGRWHEPRRREEEHREHDRGEHRGHGDNR